MKDSLIASQDNRELLNDWASNFILLLINKVEFIQQHQNLQIDYRKELFQIVEKVKETIGLEMLRNQLLKTLQILRVQLGSNRFDDQSRMHQMTHGSPKQQGSKE